jgi:hypothetical protein
VFEHCRPCGISNRVVTTSATPNAVPEEALLVKSLRRSRSPLELQVVSRRTARRAREGSTPVPERCKGAVKAGQSPPEGEALKAPIVELSSITMEMDRR